LIYSSKFADNNDVKEFLEKELNIKKINDINFTFNLNKTDKYQRTPTIVFIEKINDKKEKTITITLDDLVKKDLGFERDFFNLLSTAFLPKSDKIITNILVRFNDSLDSTCFSEGEKKLILIKFILEFLADENALILLDEPDSHIHISRKQNLRDIIKKYTNRENILTTHSPTLTHSFDLKHIINLGKDENNNVIVEGKEKRELITSLTDGIWSYEQQTIFLSSTKDIILVEGKTDITYIQTALDKLKEDNIAYKELNFEFLPFGGASGLNLFTEKFKPVKNQTIIALLDRDQAGHDSLKAIFDFKGTMAEYTTRKKNGIYITLIPKTDGYQNDNFVIEDYYGIDFIKSIMFSNAEGFTGVLKENGLKRKLDGMCRADKIEKDKFTGFKKLLDTLLQIKADSAIEVAA